MTSIVTSTYNPRSYIYSSNSETLILHSAIEETRLSFINSSYPDGNFRYVFGASSDTLSVYSISNVAHTNIQTFSTVSGVPNVEVFGSLVSSNISFSSSAPNLAKLIVFEDNNPLSSTQFSGIGLNYSTNAVEYYTSGLPYDIQRHSFYAGTSENTSIQLMTMQLNDFSGIPQVSIGIAPGTLGPTTSLSLANDLQIAGNLIVRNKNLNPDNIVLLNPDTNRIFSNMMPAGVVFASGPCNLIDSSLLPVNFSGSYFKTYKNFGIGTRTPLQRLQVQGSTYITDRLGVGIAYPASRLHVVESSATIPTAALYNTVGGDILQTFITSNTIDGPVNLPVLSIVGTHQGVGIGTSIVNPNNALDVHGNVSIRGSLTTSFNRYVTESSNTNLWNLVPSTTDINSSWICITYTGTYFIAINNISQIGISSDGIQWNIYNQQITANDICYSSTYNLLVAVGINGIMTSQNGSDWTTQNSGLTSINIKSICWSSTHNLFVAVNHTITSNIVYSYDAVNWSITTIANMIPDKIIYVPEKQQFIATGESTLTCNYATSSDGINWTPTPILNDAGLGCICYSSTLNIYLTLGYGMAAISSDGIYWTSYTIPYQIIYTSGVIWISSFNLFIAIGLPDYGENPQSCIIASSDGIHWYFQGNFGRNYPCYDIVYAPNLRKCVITAANTFITFTPVVPPISINSKIGIGTTDPIYPLDIQYTVGESNIGLNCVGTIQTSNINSSNASISDTFDASNITTSNLHVSNEIFLQNQPIITSDARIKYNTQKLTNSLTHVNNINGYTYNLLSDMNTPSQNNQYVGVIAQEIQNVLPQAVSVVPNGYLAVKYDSLIPLLIESIKELTVKVNHLESLVQKSNDTMNID